MFSKLLKRFGRCPTGLLEGQSCGDWRPSSLQLKQESGSSSYEPLLPLLLRNNFRNFFNGDSHFLTDVGDEAADIIFSHLELKFFLSYSSTSGNPVIITLNLNSNPATHAQILDTSMQDTSMQDTSIDSGLVKILAQQRIMSVLDLTFRSTHHCKKLFSTKCRWI